MEPNLRIIKHQKTRKGKKKKKLGRRREDRTREKGANRPELKGGKKHRNGGNRKNEEERRKTKAYKCLQKTEALENKSPIEKHAHVQLINA